MPGACERKVRSEVDVVADANAGRHWLQEPALDHPGSGFPAGLCNGGMRVPAGGRCGARGARPRRAPDFRPRVAFYTAAGGSAICLERACPTLILIARPTLEPAGALQQMVAGAKGRSALASLVALSGLLSREFESPAIGFPVRELTGLALYGVWDRAAPIRHQPAARTDSAHAGAGNG